MNSWIMFKLGEFMNVINSLKILRNFVLSIVFIPIYLLAQDESGWVLQWSDEFDGAGSPVSDTSGWYYNKESSMTRLARFDESAAYLEDGKLIIEAKKHGEGDYTSAGIATKAHYNQGRIVMRAKVPYSQGMWPAFWTINAPGSGPGYREIDIMEMVGGPQSGKGGDNVSFGTVWWGLNATSLERSSGHQILEDGKYADEFHTYGINWDSSKIEFFIDDEIFHTAGLYMWNCYVLHLMHEIRLNLAVGGNWPGKPDNTTVWPQKFIIDWVRIYQKDATSINEGISNSKIKIDEKLNIQIESDIIHVQSLNEVKITNVLLFDSKGRSLYSMRERSEQEIVINNLNLSNSIYFLKIELSNGVLETRKIGTGLGI